MEDVALHLTVQQHMSHICERRQALTTKRPLSG